MKPEQKTRQDNNQHNKRIVCLIDSLGSGGAQRQMVSLCRALTEAGHRVTLISYFRADRFYEDLLVANNFEHIFIRAGNKLSRILNIRKTLLAINPDAVISYLDFPNMINELSGFGHRWRVIVSERVSLGGKLSLRDWIRFQLHRLSDVVVCNSWSFSDELRELAPWLKGKVKTIINTVDLLLFSPATNPLSKEGRIEILVVASFQEKKNPFSVVHALHHIKQTGISCNLHLSWYGNNLFENGKPTPMSKCYLDTVALIEQHEIQDLITIHDPVREIVDVYRSADGVMLPSFYEGFPNVICEAMACGKPILASNVCDHSQLVREGENGFLFAPHDPKSIAEAIKKFINLPLEDRIAMGRASRTLAEKLFDKDVFLAEYMKLIPQKGEGG